MSKDGSWIKSVQIQYIQLRKWVILFQYRRRRCRFKFFCWCQWAWRQWIGSGHQRRGTHKVLDIRRFGSRSWKTAEWTMIEDRFHPFWRRLHRIRNHPYCPRNETIQTMLPNNLIDWQSCHWHLWVRSSHMEGCSLRRCNWRRVRPYRRQGNWRSRPTGSYNCLC